MQHKKRQDRSHDKSGKRETEQSDKADSCEYTLAPLFMTIPVKSYQQQCDCYKQNQTSRHAQSLSSTFIPKILAALLAVFFFGGWMFMKLIDYSRENFQMLMKILQ